MTNEETIKMLEKAKHRDITIFDMDNYYNALEMSIAALKFVKWVATEIFDDMWEYNKDAFAEIACRKLAKLGIVRAKGDEWVLVDEEGESE